MAPVRGDEASGDPNRELQQVLEAKPTKLAA
jgi:hypothetical protein